MYGTFLGDCVCSQVSTGGDQHRERRGILGGLRDWLQGDEKNIARAMDAGVMEGAILHPKRWILHLKR